MVARSGPRTARMFSVTGETRYRQAAQKAFEYERGLLNSRAANWPDFREPAIFGPTGEKAYSFATAWCHGAPGIAISRLRAYELFRDRLCRESQPVNRLPTTPARNRRMVENRNGELFVMSWFGREFRSPALWCASVGVGLHRYAGACLSGRDSGNHKYAKPGREWPCGSPGGEAPGLMTGLAGIGYFYLHLSGAPAPFVLALRREEF